MGKLICIIDGDFMRRRVIESQSFYYSGPAIRQHCLRHLLPGEELLRILYYAAAPYGGQGVHPKTGEAIDFGRTEQHRMADEFFRGLAGTPQMALRLGRLAWQYNAWNIAAHRLPDLLSGRIEVADLGPEDIRPDFRQKAVDMRIGLDIATIALKRQAERLVLITNDADFVPAVKLARREGLTVCLDPLWAGVSADLREHVDYVRNLLEVKSDGFRRVSDPKEYDPSLCGAGECASGQGSPGGE